MVLLQIIYNEREVSTMYIRHSQALRKIVIGNSCRVQGSTLCIAILVCEADELSVRGQVKIPNGLPASTNYIKLDNVISKSWRWDHNDSERPDFLTYMSGLPSWRSLEVQSMRNTRETGETRETMGGLRRSGWQSIGGI